MSDTSELLFEYLKSSQQNMHGKLIEASGGDEQDPMVLVERNLFDPTFPAHLFTYNERGLTLIRRAFREMAGGEPWQTSVEALAAVKEQLLPSLRVLPLQALADGFQLTGEQSSFAIKKYTRMGKLDQIFKSEVFNQASELIAMEYLADPDCVALVEATIMNAVLGLGELTGYKNYEGALLHHIWDLFLMVCRSVCVNFYLAGRDMGQRTADQDELSGILAATEKLETE